MSKWKDAGKRREGDFFAKPPWWLRIGRLLKPAKKKKPPKGRR